MMQNVDRELITKAQHKDITAFEGIYRTTSSFIYAVIFGVLHNEDDAQDIMQDVYIKIFKNLAGYRFESSFTTWIYRIAMNTALNAANKRNREDARKADFDSAVETVTSHETAGRCLEKEESVRVLYALLETINPDQRACLLLREIEGMDYRSIAETLQININTVRTRLKRARIALLQKHTEEVVSYGL